MRGILSLLLHVCAALGLSLVLGGVASALAQPMAAADVSEPQAAPLAVVVLIGEAGKSLPLGGVIEELLEHQRVQSSVEMAERFEPNDWLDRSPTDARTFAFVAVPTQKRAQLFFRGPRGERFLLRELALRNGLDEVGRELIARVVETSVVALLHSSEGVSREEARAGLAKSKASEPAGATPAPTLAPALSAAPVPVHERGLHALLGLRALGQFTGSDLGARAALGLEGALAFERPSGPELRARLSVEAALPQTFAGNDVSARVLTLPLRLGMDVGSVFDVYVGLSTGVDIVYLDPQSASRSGLRLLHNSTMLALVSRAELRYEPHFADTWWLAVSVLADVSWKTTHYDVINAASRQHVATPWRIVPGIALSLGVLP